MPGVFVGQNTPGFLEYFGILVRNETKRNETKRNERKSLHHVSRDKIRHVFGVFWPPCPGVFLTAILNAEYWTVFPGDEGSRSIGGRYTSLSTFKKTG